MTDRARVYETFRRDFDQGLTLDALADWDIPAAAAGAMRKRDDLASRIIAFEAGRRLADAGRDLPEAGLAHAAAKFEDGGKGPSGDGELHGLFVFDAEGRLMHASPEPIRRAGLAPEQVVGRRGEEILPPEAWRGFAPRFGQAKQGRITQGHGWLDAPQGSRSQSYVAGPIRRDGEVVGVLVLAADVPYVQIRTSVEPAPTLGRAAEEKTL